MARNQTLRMKAIAAALTAAAAMAQNPQGYSVPTPRPVNPAQGSTTPSAQATQRQNPFLGSVPDAENPETLQISFAGALERALRHNLGLVESNDTLADVRADRLRALSAMLPPLRARAKQGFEDHSLKEIGLKLPPIPGFPGLPATSGAFGFEEARVRLSQSIFRQELRDRYRSQQQNEKAAQWSAKDARDVVTFAAGTAYLQVIAS